MADAEVEVLTVVEVVMVPEVVIEAGTLQVLVAVLVIEV